MKWMKNLLFWQKDEITKAAELSRKRYGDAYRKLEQFDKGELKDKNIILKLDDLRKLIQSN